MQLHHNESNVFHAKIAPYRIDQNHLPLPLIVFLGGLSIRIGFTAFIENWIENPVFNPKLQMDWRSKFQSVVWIAIRIFSIRIGNPS